MNELMGECRVSLAASPSQRQFEAAELELDEEELDVMDQLV